MKIDSKQRNLGIVKQRNKLEQKKKSTEDKNLKTKKPLESMKAMNIKPNQVFILKTA